jgi:hypothetical protein
MPGSLGTPASSSPILVVDSWPAMEWFKKRRPIADRFRLLIEEARVGGPILLMSSINLGEIYYNCWNAWDEARADEALAYADAFAAVLAMEFGATVLTGDPDFLKLRDAGLIAVEWLVR